MVRYVISLEESHSYGGSLFPLLDQQHWSDFRSVQDYTAVFGRDGISVTVAVDFGGDRGCVCVTDQDHVRVEKPTEPGTKTGQEKTFKVDIDGGHVGVLFKWRSRIASWEADRVFVAWSLKKAASTAAKAVYRLVLGVRDERAKTPILGSARQAALVAQHAGDCVRSLDEQIVEAEKVLSDLRAEREKQAVAQTDAERLSRDHEIAETAKEVRIAKMIDEAHADLVM